jgi:hypothetical protein
MDIIATILTMRNINTQLSSHIDTLKSMTFNKRILRDTSLLHKQENENF